MAQWYREKTAGQADPTEALVAEQLTRLDDDWMIRWGFHFADGYPEERDREGDFLILGPDGRLLVMEVKGGRNRQYVLTGEWEHRGRNPLDQLLGEWQAVIALLERHRGNGRLPYVGKALCMPHLNLLSEDRLRGEFGRDQLITRDDLKDFPAWWKRAMAPHKTVADNARRLFSQVLAPGIRPNDLQLFIRETDRVLDRYQRSSFALVEAVNRNQQLLIEGGVGSGKTFMALYQAEHYARSGDGQRVLLLCYNLLLAERLRMLVARLKLPRGEIIVRSWEELIGEVLHSAGLALEEPGEGEERARYWRMEVPGLVEMAFAEERITFGYDALVVDEAQDHDTAFPDGCGADGPLGWWGWYHRMLRGGVSAPITVLYDQAQRPRFREETAFDPQALAAAWSQPAFVCLPRALRYTDKIGQYLRTLSCPATKALVAGLELAPNLPLGPEVITREASREETLDVVEDIIRAWKRSGLPSLAHVAIIGPERELADTALGPAATVGGEAIRPCEQAAGYGPCYASAWRVKGLDFLGVIIIGFPPFAELAAGDDPYRQEAFFMAASRARQFLAVIGEED